VLETTYFFAASIARRERVQGLGPRLRVRRRTKRRLHHFVGHPAKEERIGPGEVIDRVTMQFLIRVDYAVIAATVQRHIDGIAKRSHRATAPVMASSTGP
jgi:hypothetical protein